MDYLMRPAPRLLSDLVAEQLAAGSATRKELCELLGVSRTSLGRAVTELLDDGPLLSVVDGQRSIPGRPVQKLQLNTNVGYRLGIDISRAGCYAVVLNRVYKEIIHVECPMTDVNHWCEALRTVCRLLTKQGDEQGLVLSSISKVGIGVPVPINEESIEYRGQQQRIQDIVGEYWNAPILIENTVRLGAIGEARWGAGRGIPSQLYVRLSGGVGCCLAISDTITGGQAGNAGEFGHIHIPGLDEPCHCGKSGCVETIASAPSVCRAAGVRNLEELRAILDLSIDDKSDSTIADRAARAWHAVQTAGKVVGEQIAAIVLIANPQIVVCAGSLVRAVPEVLLAISEAVASYLPPVLEYRVRVDAGLLGHRGAALGAAFAADFAVEAERHLSTVRPEQSSAIYGAHDRYTDASDYEEEW